MVNRAAAGPDRDISEVKLIDINQDKTDKFTFIYIS